MNSKHPAQFNRDTGASQGDREARPPATSTNYCHPPQWHGSAEPLPLHLNTGPYALRNRLGELARGVINLREGKRRASADRDLAGVDLPAAANVLSSNHCDGNNRRPTL